MSCLVISLAISSIILPIIIIIARKYEITDKPGGRKSHKEPIPLLGGLGIFISFTLTMLIYVGNRIPILLFIACSGIMVAMGTIDDIKDIKAIYKMGTQVIGVMLIALSGIRFNLGDYLGQDGIWLYIIEVIISTIWMVGITNAINIIDGLDGLAGGTSIIAGAAFFIIFLFFDYNLLSQISASLMGAILGFLIYNFYPSKVFMGDGGSLFIGFMLSILSIIYVNIHKELSSLLVPIIILAVPIFETGSSILRRTFKGRSIMEADTGHIHNKLVERGLSQVATVSIIYAWGILVGTLGIIVAVGNLFHLGLLIILLLTAIGVRMHI